MMIKTVNVLCYIWQDWVKYFCLGLFFFTNQTIYGQGQARHAVCVVIPEIAILAIEPNNSPIHLKFNGTSSGGEPLTFSQSNGTKWINYTSSIPNGGSNRVIMAQITSGSLPAGVQLSLSAGNAQGSGKGALGTSTGQVTLSSSPKAIIHAIGRSFTGSGNNNGHQLNYVLSISDYKKLKATNNQSITVTYTITE